MPWDVRKAKGSGYDIVDKDQKVVGHSETKAKAEASVRARYANSGDEAKSKAKPKKGT
jgi:hypothetical protein